MHPWLLFVGVCLSCRTEWGQTENWTFSSCNRWGGVWKRGAAVMGSSQVFLEGEQEVGCPSHLGSPRWLVTLLAMQRVQQRWVSVFDLEILAPLHASLWCQGFFTEKRHFYELCSNVYDFPLEARGWGLGEEQNTTKLPRPEVQTTGVAGEPDSMFSET